MITGFLRYSSGECVQRLQQMARVAGTAELGFQSHDPFLSCRDLERLASLQQQVSRNYFRLLEAHRVLRKQSFPKSPGAILTEELERERQRLGRELHTGVGQALAGIHIHVGNVQEWLPDPPERVRISLSRIASLASNALDEVRAVSRRLYVPAWQAYGLVEALRRLWEDSGIPENFVGSTFELQKLSAEPPMDVRAALYRAAQEGLSNVIRHAHAHRVRLALREERGRITLEVEDDGSGFTPPEDLAQPSASAGIGLRSMRELARELGGDLQIQSDPQGTKLTITFPVIP